MPTFGSGSPIYHTVAGLPTHTGSYCHLYCCRLRFTRFAYWLLLRLHTTHYVRLRLRAAVPFTLATFRSHGSHLLHTHVVTLPMPCLRVRLRFPLRCYVLYVTVTYVWFVLTHARCTFWFTALVTVYTLHTPFVAVLQLGWLGYRLVTQFRFTCPDATLHCPRATGLYATLDYRSLVRVAVTVTAFILRLPVAYAHNICRTPFGSRYCYAVYRTPFYTPGCGSFTVCYLPICVYLAFCGYAFAVALLPARVPTHTRLLLPHVYLRGYYTRFSRSPFGWIRWLLRGLGSRTVAHLDIRLYRLRLLRGYYRFARCAHRVRLFTTTCVHRLPPAVLGCAHRAFRFCTPLRLPFGLRCGFTAPLFHPVHGSVPLLHYLCIAHRICRCTRSCYGYGSAVLVLLHPHYGSSLRFVCGCAFTVRLLYTFGYLRRLVAVVTTLPLPRLHRHVLHVTPLRYLAWLPGCRYTGYGRSTFTHVPYNAGSRILFPLRYGYGLRFCRLPFTVGYLTFTTCGSHARVRFTTHAHVYWFPTRLRLLRYVPRFVVVRCGCLHTRGSGCLLVTGCTVYTHATPAGYYRFTGYLTLV